MGGANGFVLVAQIAFLLAVFTCFTMQPAHRAVLWTLIGGWLFLPHQGFAICPTKSAFIGAAVLAGSILTDSRSWARFRPHLLDAAATAVCWGPCATALYNGLGAKEGLAASLDAFLTWGAPYLLGRVHLGDWRGLREFASALVLAAIIYAPLCLWEIRMSPQLHTILYGFRPWSFDQSYRYGGFRPSVFMQHGLALGMFMTLGTLIAYWLWRADARKTIARIPLGWTVVLLLCTTVLCKSAGALVLLFLGIAVLEATRALRTSAVVLLLAAVPPLYCGARVAGWDGAALVAFTRARLGEDRAGSIGARITSERLMIDRALTRPWLGWGRFGRAFVFREDGALATVPDSLWIIAFAFNGLLGLASTFALLVLAPVLLDRAFPARWWADARLAATGALAVGLLLWAIDDLLNYMMAPIFPATAGALVTLTHAVASRRRAARRVSFPRRTTVGRPIQSHG